MAKITINFLGAWQLFFTERSVQADVATMEEARRYVEERYEDKIQARGLKETGSIWEHSTILLNGKVVGKDQAVTLKDGDRLDLLFIVAGG